MWNTEIERRQGMARGLMMMLVPRTRKPLDEEPGANVGIAPIRLADGARVHVRELLPSDEESIRIFYRGLSPSTLGRRFLTPYTSLPEPMLRYLAVAGGADRCVIVATHGGAIVGEARFHRAGGSDGAEVAVVVADDWQGRGLGTELAGRLAGMARARGVTALTGSMRADNRAAVGLLGSLAPAADRRIGSGELEFRAPLPVPRERIAGNMHPWRRQVGGRTTPTTVRSWPSSSRSRQVTTSRSRDG